MIVSSMSKGVVCLYDCESPLFKWAYVWCWVSKGKGKGGGGVLHTTALLITCINKHHGIDDSRSNTLFSS